MRLRLSELMDEWNLKHSRTNPRLTQLRLVEETGISKTTISKLFNNQSTQIHFETIERLCEFFHCQPGDLFELQDE